MSDLWNSDPKGGEGISSVEWGDILGTLSDQTDLQAALDAKAGTGDLHDALTVTDSAEIDFTLTGQDLTASLKTGSIDILKLDAGVQTSLGLADSALQSFTETDPIFTASQAFNIDAGDITNLSNLSGTNTGDQDLSGYALLAGRAGGQTLIGGTGASEALTLQSTSHATKGKILFGTSAYDEVNNRLGIGINVPAATLDVFGTAKIKASLTNGNGLFDLYSNNETAAWRFQATDSSGAFIFRNITNSSNPFSIEASAPSSSVYLGASETVINDNGESRDFRVEGDTNANLLFADASTDRVGIGTASPTQRLEVSGGNILAYQPTTGVNIISQRGDGATVALAAGSSVGRFQFNGTIGFAINENSSANILAGTAAGGTDYMTFDHRTQDIIMLKSITTNASPTGNVGIGTEIMTGKLNVDQSSTTAAIPVLVLDQADVSEEMIEFVTTIGTGNAIEAVGAKTLTTTHFVKVTIPGGLTRYIPCGTIA